MIDEKERARTLGATLSQIEKQFGKGSIIRLGARDVQAVPSISSGSISVDFALGIGGFPRGPHHRDLRAGIVGENDGCIAGGRRGAEGWRHGGVYRRGTCARSGVCAQGWEWTSIIYSSRSRITGSRRWKLRNALITSGSIDVLVVDSVAAAGAESRARRRDGR